MALAVALGACVGLPPSPPGQSGGSSGTSGGSTTVSGDTEGTMSADGTGTEDTGPMSECGNGAIEGDEECDLGPDNGGGGYCTDACTANVCGDGYLGPGEACDDGNASNEDACTTACGLATCGDGLLQEGEECDDGQGNNARTGACLPSCIRATCGDLLIHEGVELCDGVNTGGQSCETLGLGGGVLACADDCSDFDTSDCRGTSNCGNGRLDDGEFCDGSDLGGQTCGSQGYDEGALGCTAQCSYDVSGCYSCGNGVTEGPEACDGADLDGQTCTSVLGAVYRGTLGCLENCLLDTAACCLQQGAPCQDDGDCCSFFCDAGTSHCGA